MGKFQPLRYRNGILWFRWILWFTLWFGSFGFPFYGLDFNFGVSGFYFRVSDVLGFGFQSLVCGLFFALALILSKDAFLFRGLGSEDILKFTKKHEKSEKSRKNPKKGGPKKRVEFGVFCTRCHFWQKVRKMAS